MKLAILSLSTLASQAFSQALSSKCDDSGNLVLDIPYPDTAPTPKLLRYTAGDCTEADEVHRFEYDETRKVAVITIPKAECEISSDDLDHHSTPLTYRSGGGLYLPTAEIVLGDRINNMDIIFRSMKIAAECGQRTSYTVKFDYKDISATDNEDCVIVDGACVFPAYEDNIVLAIKEYTSDAFDTEVTELNRAKIAGENIYLSMRAVTIDAGLHFAVKKCEVISSTGDRFTLLHPGATLDTPATTATCSLDGVGLSAAYDQAGNFNFQHVLFMLNEAGIDGVSSFSLECTAEICDESEVGSKCKTAATVCGGYAQN